MRISGISCHRAARRAAIAALLGLVWAVAAEAQGTKIAGQVLRDSGRPAGGATVRICAQNSTGPPCTPLKTIYSNVTLTTTITQPGFVADAQGNYEFYLADGEDFDVEYSGIGLVTRKVKDLRAPAKTTSTPVGLTTNVTNTTTQQIGHEIFPGSTTGGTALSPDTAPSVTVLTTGGSIVAGDWQFVITYGNKNGETLQSPASTCQTLTGSTNKIQVKTADYRWLTGTYKMRVYARNSCTTGSYFVQTPRTISWTVSSNDTKTVHGTTGAVRASNVVTITTTAAHGVFAGQIVVLSGINAASTDFNGTFRAETVPSGTTLTYNQTGPNETSQNGTLTNPAIARLNNEVVGRLTTTLTSGLGIGQKVNIVGVTDATFVQSDAFIRDILQETATSTIFRYEVTSGATANSTGGTTEFFTGLDTNWHLVTGVNGRAVTFTAALATSGTQPPGSTTAVIDPLHVSINAGRLGTDTGQYAESPLALYAIRGPKAGDPLFTATHTLTTPLILGYFQTLVGPRNDIALTGCLSSNITSSFSDENIGTVMVMGRNVTLANLCISAGASNGVMYFATSNDMNGQVLDGVFISSSTSADRVAPIRIFGIREAHAWDFNRVSVTGGRYGLLAHNSYNRGLYWYKGRINVVGTFDTRHAVVHGSGYPNYDDMTGGGAADFGYMDLTMDAVVIESTKGRAVTFLGGYLHIKNGAENADLAVVTGGKWNDTQIFYDDFISGDVYEGFKVEKTSLFADGTIPVIRFGNHGFPRLDLENVDFVNANVAIDLNLRGSVTGWSTNADESSGASTKKVINDVATNRSGASLVGFLGSGSRRTPLVLRGRDRGAGTNGSACLDFGTTANGSRDLFLYTFGDTCSSGAAVRFGNFGNTDVVFATDIYIRTATLDSNSFTTSMKLTSTPTGNRVVTFPDETGTVAYIGRTQTWTGNNTFAEPIIVTKATGTAPLTISSTTEVANLNAQQWHSKVAIDFSGTLDFGSILEAACAELTITATGAVANNAIAASWPAALEDGLIGNMRISANDTVTVRLCNVTVLSIDPASRTYAGRVIK